MGHNAVATEDTYALDEVGTRRWVAKGYKLPAGWRFEGESPTGGTTRPEVEASEPKPKPKSGRQVSKPKKPK